MDAKPSYRGMNLVDYQQDLARSVMAGPGDANGVDRGVAVTAEVRRSWCEARTVKAGPITLSVLPINLRRDHLPIEIALSLPYSNPNRHNTHRAEGVP